MLSERKVKILQSIVEDYINTVEPVGSRTLAKKYNLGISSATIRNEMSDLEEMGLIVQPHASAGRIPSDKGYRMFVDQLMHHKQLNSEETLFLQKIIETNIRQIDYLMQETARAVSFLTRYTTIISKPKAKVIKIKHIQLLPVDDSSIAAVVVTDERAVKNSIINVGVAPTTEVLLSLSNKLNQCIAKSEDLDICELYKIDIIKEHEVLIKSVLEFALETANDQAQVFLSGAKNLLSFPEFNDIEKAKDVFNALEEQAMLVTMLSQTEDSNIKITIGSENGLVEFKNCSFITTGYKLSDNTAGSIGIIGPTRMNYEQVVSVLNCLVTNIDNVIKALSGG